MLLFTLASNFVELNYVIAGNSIGYSLASNCIAWYLFNCTNKKYCWFTRNAPIGLGIINLIDIIGFYIEYQDYNKIFNISVCAIILILALIFFLIKRHKK